MDYRWFIALYFLPTIISLFNPRSRTLLIFVGNICWSWTIFYWFGSLVWAFCDTKTEEPATEFETEEDAPRSKSPSGSLVSYIDPIIKWWKNI